MKKRTLFLLPLLLLISCTNPQTYTLKEATGGAIGVENFTHISISYSLWQCSTWPWPYEDCSSLDVDYVLTNKDIQYSFFTEEGAKNAQAVYVHVSTDFEDIACSSDAKFISLYFVIDRSSRYIYFSLVESNFRSLNKVSKSYINGFNS